MGRFTKGSAWRDDMPRGYLKEVDIGIAATGFTQANEAGDAAITAWLAENVGWALHYASVKLTLSQVRFLAVLVG